MGRIKPSAKFADNLAERLTATTCRERRIPVVENVERGHAQCPVFLNALPRPHPQLPEPQMLLDIPMKRLDTKTLGIMYDGFFLGKAEVVGDEKLRRSVDLGNENRNIAYAFKKSDKFRGIYHTFLRQPDRPVSARPLCQVARPVPPVLDVDDAVGLDCRDISPRVFRYVIEDGFARVPSVA